MSKIQSLLQRAGATVSIASCFAREEHYVSKDDIPTNYRECDAALRTSLKDAFLDNYINHTGDYKQGGIFRQMGYAFSTLEDVQVMMTDGLNYLAGLATGATGCKGFRASNLIKRASQ